MQALYAPARHFSRGFSFLPRSPSNRQSVIQNKVSVGIVLLRGLSDLEEKHPSLREFTEAEGSYPTSCCMHVIIDAFYVCCAERSIGGFDSSNKS